MDVVLQPLRIPSGWRIEWNTLFEEEPSDPANAQGYYYGGTNLFLANNPGRRQAIDVEWRANDGQPAIGRYRLFVLRLIDTYPATRGRKGGEFAADWDDPLFAFESISRVELVRVLEACLSGQKRQAEQSAAPDGDERS